MLNNSHMVNSSEISDFDYSELLRLTSQGVLDFETISEEFFELTPEGNEYLKLGSPEFRCLNDTSIIKDVLSEYSSKIPESAVIGRIKMMRSKNIKEDITVNELKKINSNSQLDCGLIKRGLIKKVLRKSFQIQRGKNFGNDIQTTSELTEEQIKSGEWKNLKYKPINFQSNGLKNILSGSLHPLLEMERKVKSIFMNMGFEEMNGDEWITSSFWNFDSLFQGQQHPCRDSHDTFYLNNPMNSNLESVPQGYYERVKEKHESILNYEFDNSIPITNILRTHTTALASKTIFKLINEMGNPPIYPIKRFIIGRVYRNETMDATHLCEFHQCEMFVIDYKQSLGDLMNYIRKFFSGLGFSEDRITFKPCYNPYTEPSMEVFAYHEGLNKEIELGNSGMFRPEMLEPMGIDKDLNIIAFGLSLERPTMILNGIKSIKELY